MISLSKAHKIRKIDASSFECVALLLQGGGALGAYQGGVYQALSEADLHPNWVAGISIGAVNASIIAGNPPEVREKKLRAFWQTITEGRADNWLHDWWFSRNPSATLHKILNQFHTAAAISLGVPGLFSPRLPVGLWFLLAASEATSIYTTEGLRASLLEFVDFDLINSGKTRLSVGAVNVRSGNFVYFDTTTHVISVDHILASAALPPGLPATEIEGELYWDGGLVSNTPLQWVLQYGPQQHTLAFQVDLWCARGDFPVNLMEVATRQKEILYSSRTRENTERFKIMQKLRHTIANLLQQLPDELRNGEAAAALQSYSSHKNYNLVHLIYHTRPFEGYSKDYDFSRLSMSEHWKTGYYDTLHTLRQPEIFQQPQNFEGVAVFDFTRSGQR